MISNALIFHCFLLIASIAADKSKIIAGEAASLEEFPFIVQIEWNKGKGWFLGCAGVLLTDSTVLSTGQCMTGFQKEELRILANDTHLGEGYSRSVKELIIHENYTTLDNGVPDFDLSLLVLDKPVFLSNSTKPINVATHEPKKGEAVSIAGWGSSVPDSPVLSDYLQKADLSIVGRPACNKIYNDIAQFANITEQFICAGDLEGKKGACTGDAGGPLVSAGELVGLISFSWGCADPDFSLVLVNVHYFSDWILQKLSIVK